MEIKTISVGNIFTKSYIIIDSNENAYIIDPGDEGEKLFSFLKKENLELKYIINTHGHFDHIGANKFLKKKTGAQIIIHKNDDELLTDPSKNLSNYFYASKNIISPSADKLVDDREILELGDFKFEIIHTPGHTSGGISLYNQEEKILFSGDTIFSNGIGRTDLPGADKEALKHSIENKLLTLDPNTMVYPGHGNSIELRQFKNNIWPSLYRSLT